MSNLNQIESCNDYSHFSSRPRFCGHPHGASRPRRPGAGSLAVHSHPARAAYSPHQRGEGLRGPSWLGVSLRHTGIRRQTHDIRRRRSAQRPLPRSLDRLHHGPRQEAGHLPRQTHRTQRTRGKPPANFASSSASGSPSRRPWAGTRGTAGRATSRRSKSSPRLVRWSSRGS